MIFYNNDAIDLKIWL